MVTVPLGVGAYKRLVSGEPVVQVVNRYAEKAPTNLREHVKLLGRPGSAPLVNAAGGSLRGFYSKNGLFNSDLFIVSGGNFWRFTTGGVLTQITGTLSGTGFPYVTWQKGIGYERLVISDGTALQYFNEHAFGTLTLAGGPITNQVIQIGGVFYSWNANVDAGAPAGTSANPWLAKLGTGGVNQAANDTQSLANMASLLNFSGISGFTYSSALPGPSALVTASSDLTTLLATAIDNTSGGNLIATTIFSGAFLSWSAATLTGGGGAPLQPITGMAPGEVPKAVANVSSYVLVSVGNTPKFYWINPGEVIIDPLNFAEKESNPDNILDMLSVGDQVVIAGDGSTENWYASGNFAAPFVPQEGRVYQRGIVEGTPVVMKDSVVLIGNDGVVYEIGYQFGTTSQWGVHRISNEGIEERIRVQLRREQGLPP